MTSIRGAIAAFVWVFATAAYGAPDEGSFADVVNSAKTSYDAARTDLMALGKKAKAAATAGDYAAWKPANDAYVKQVGAMTALCEKNVLAVTGQPTDLSRIDNKALTTAFSQYVDIAGSMTKARLQLLAYATLAARFADADRATLVKALASQYLAGE